MYMKKVLALVAAAGIMSVATLASATTIVGSPHDMTLRGATGSTQICVYCHAPHNAIQSLPLWNRINPAGSAFTLYSGLNMSNVSFKSGFTADSTSLFCMSCHDGQTSISAIHNAGRVDGGTVQGNATHINTGAFSNGPIANSTNIAGNLTRDLSKTHPINFPVVSNATGDLNTPSLTSGTMGPMNATTAGTAMMLGISGTEPTAITATFPLFKTTDPLNPLRATVNRSLECGSCHAVHDYKFVPFLRTTLGGSALCLGCHNK